MNTPPGWTFRERGWMTSEGVGGICRERDGAWWGYPQLLNGKLGPYRTAKSAAGAVCAITELLRATSPVKGGD